jgi:hypothetical protein
VIRPDNCSSITPGGASRGDGGAVGAGSAPLPRAVSIGPPALARAAGPPRYADCKLCESVWKTGYYLLKEFGRKEVAPQSCLLYHTNACAPKPIGLAEPLTTASD